MSFFDELDSFMGAVRQSNTGSPDNAENYQRVYGNGNVRLLGPYMIRSDEWEPLAEQAGIPGAN